MKTQIPAEVKAAIFRMVMLGTPRKAVLAWITRTAEGLSTPVTPVGMTLKAFVQSPATYEERDQRVRACKTYARNYRPNRCPAREAGRKVKYNKPGTVHGDGWPVDLTKLVGKTIRYLAGCAHRLDTVKVTAADNEDRTLRVETDNGGWTLGRGGYTLIDRLYLGVVRSKRRLADAA